MKPIRLELKQFGPYKHEIIEWNKIINEPIFLITGKTGSGKSTLFDAMTYALYNKTSTGKAISSLRTQTASDKDKTVVIFDFELKGKHYRVERTLGYKKEGNKSTTSGKVILLEIENEEEKILAMREAEAKEKILDIIGLDDKQFCQIIILPQGKFKEFLLSNSNEKKETLRSLFDTYFYQKFVDELKEYAKDLDSNYKLKEREVITKFEQFNFDEELAKFEFLKEENFEEIVTKLEVQEEKLRLKENELDLFEVELENFNKNYRALEKISEKFEELDFSKKDMEVLKKDKPRIENVKNKIIRLEDLNRNKDNILLYEKNIIKEKALEAEKSTLQMQQKTLEEKEMALREVETELIAGKNNIEDLRELVAKYRYFYENIDSFKTSEKNIKFYEDKLSLLEDAKAKLVDFDNKLSTINESLEEATEEKHILESSIGTLDLDILKKDSEEEKLVNFEKIERSLKTRKISLERNEERLIALKNEEVILKKEVEKLEKNSQQEILNKFLVHLHEGDTCPLCQQKIQKLPQINEVKKEDSTVKKDFEKISKEVIKVETLILKEREDITSENKQQEKNKLEINFNVREQLTHLKEERQEEVDKLEKVKKLEEKLKIDQKEILEKIEVLKNEVSSEEEYKVKLAEAKVNMNQYNEKVKEDLADFEISYIKREKKVNDFDEKKKNYDEKRSNLLIAERELGVNIKNNKDKIIEIKEELNFLSKKFNETTLVKYYKNFEEAKDDLVQLDILPKYKDEVATYENKEKLLLEKVTLLEDELKNINKPNLEEESTKLREKTKERDAKKREVIILSSTFEANTILYKNLYKEFRDLGEKIKTAQEVIAFSNIVSGKSESKKSLETYVQGYYLDLILSAGTKRLLEMTNGRYSFERKIEGARGTGLKGLDININDFYLNSEREASSLSGGELFLASLALALGLAEVIQNNSGGISLETIFIDEGFGTLDPETLDVAITTLIDIQSYGRNIGIISHVSELKERIQPKIEVYSENNYAKVKITGL